MKRLIWLLLISSCFAQTWSAWNGTTVGTSAGNISAWNGTTIGTSATNLGKWDGLNSPGGGATFAIGLDFRSTVAYVTDTGNNCPFVTDNASTRCTSYTGSDYGTTARTKTAPNGSVLITQWASSCGQDNRDRNNANDARLAGIMFAALTNATCTLNFTFPSSGTYKVVVAMGDATSSQCGALTCQLNFKDGVGGSLLLRVDNHNEVAGTIPNDHYIGSDSIDYTNANWVSTGSTITSNVTISTTVLSMEITISGGSGTLPVAYIGFSQ